MESHPDNLEVALPIDDLSFLSLDGIEFNQDNPVACFRELEKRTATITRDWEVSTIEEIIEALLLLYNAQNFTGRLNQIELNTHPLVSVLCTADFSEKRTHCCRSLLSCDGEILHPCVMLPEVLLAAVVLERSLPMSNVWRLRVVHRHQLSLERPAHSLHIETMTCISQINETEPASGILLELSIIFAFYKEYERSQDYLEKAIERSGVVIRERCIVGFRTHWQQTPHAQKLVDATSSFHHNEQNSNGNTPNVFTIPNPIDEFASEHGVLDRPVENTDGSSTNGNMVSDKLSRTDQALLIALCDRVHQHNPRHRLTLQDALLYLERLMVVPKHETSYALRVMILLRRCQHEHTRVRVRGRAFLQHQELVDSLDAERRPNDQPVLYRALLDLYMLDYQPLWRMKREFADVCVKEIMLKTALDLYTSIFDFTNVEKCCKGLGWRSKAEALAREQLESDPQNVTWWVALGEATRDEQVLLKACDLSQGKNASVYRALATLAMERNEWSSVVKYVDQAFQINPLFGGDWFAFGFALMKVKDVDRALVAFTHVCKHEPENTHAWCNLGTLLLRKGNLKSSFHAFAQALHNNQHNWPIWYNYFVVACELGDIREAIRALSLLLDSQGRQLQLRPEELQSFVTAVTSQTISEEKMISTSDDIEMSSEEMELADGLFDNLTIEEIQSQPTKNPLETMETVTNIRSSDALVLISESQPSLVITTVIRLSDLSSNPRVHLAAAQILRMYQSDQWVSVLMRVTREVNRQPSLCHSTEGIQTLLNVMNDLVQIVCELTKEKSLEVAKIKQNIKETFEQLRIFIENGNLRKLNENLTGSNLRKFNKKLNETN